MTSSSYSSSSSSSSPRVVGFAATCVVAVCALGCDPGPGNEVNVSLGDADGFALLAKSGISTVPTSVITGDVGLSPAAGTFITGFALTADASTTFSTSPQVTGKVYSVNDAEPTPTDLTTAVSDMETAYTDAAGRAAGVTELGAGEIGGLTLEPDVYKWGTGLLVSTDVTLNGSDTDIWVFQIAQDLTVANGVRMILTGGALPENIIWQVAGAVDLGTTAHGEGLFLGQTGINLETGASVNGRLLAQTAITLDAATITAP